MSVERSTDQATFPLGQVRDVYFENDPEILALIREGGAVAVIPVELNTVYVAPHDLDHKLWIVRKSDDPTVNIGDILDMDKFHSVLDRRFQIIIEGG